MSALFAIIFRSFWTWLGTVILIYAVGEVVTVSIKLWRQK